VAVTYRHMVEEVEICSSMEEVVKEVEVTYRHRVGEMKEMVGVEICKHMEEGVKEMVEVDNYIYEGGGEGEGVGGNL